LMILRGPPGGLSSASYKNIATSITVKKTENTSNRSTRSKVELIENSGVEVSGEIAPLGIGLGMETLELSGSGVEFSNEWIKGERDDYRSETKQMEYTTTWSYTTSVDPWIAGKLSDVFVVPSLILLYRTVTEIKVKAGTCTAEKSEKSVFDVDQGDDESLIFYNRYHIQNVVLKQLEENIDIKIKEIQEKVGKIAGKCAYNIPDTSTTIKEVKEIISNMINENLKDGEVCKAYAKNIIQLLLLLQGMGGWKQTLQKDEQITSNSDSSKSVVDWFSLDEYNRNKFGTTTNEDLKHKTSVISPELQRNAIRLWEGNSATSLADITQISFSGGSQLQQMDLKKQYLEEHLQNGNRAENVFETKTVVGLDLELVAEGLTSMGKFFGDLFTKNGRANRLKQLKNALNKAISDLHDAFDESAELLQKLKDDQDRESQASQDLRDEQKNIRKNLMK